MAMGVQVPRPHPDFVQDIVWDGLVAFMDTVACSGVRLPEIRRSRCLTPLATGGLGLRGEGVVWRRMLHARVCRGFGTLRNYGVRQFV